MSLFGKLVISLIVAAIASAITAYAGSHVATITLFAAFAAATVATTLVTTSLGSMNTPASNSKTTPAKKVSSSKKTQKNSPKKASGGKREEGLVKWFNVSKGFGFISRESGEEIFVHFRSIRGEGRRSLRDGQKVSFVVADSDKGLQAEEVDALD
jgi:CspA family cold shock protein